MYTRIKVPKFKVGKYVLNEYELRQLQLEILKGEKKGMVNVKDLSHNTWHKIDDKGVFDRAPKGFSINSNITLEILAIRRKSNEESFN